MLIVYYRRILWSKLCISEKVEGKKYQKKPEAPKSTGLKMEKKDDAPNFENMIYESNLARQARKKKE